jgi:hypothetical protein
MSKTNWNELRDRAYKIACDHGFHEEKLSDNHYLMLVMTELSEAVEADRKKKHADLDKFNSYINKGGEFWRFFTVFVKDTVEDELADAAIRLLDFAGLKNIDLSDRFIISYIVSKKKSFTENCFAIIHDIVNYKYTTEELVNYAIRQVRELASFYDIDLFWHIEQKMRYNELRPYKNGKEY